MDEDGLIRILRDFRDRRDWQQFHNPKNLAVSVSIEAGELLEVFQWLTPDESLHLDTARRERLTDEIADVGIYLLLLADAYGISVEKAISDKITRNEIRFPVSGQEKG
jgi:dCTP diphosphatase